MSALKNMAAYDAVPTNMYDGKHIKRLYYASGSSISFKTRSYTTEKWCEAGTRVTEYRDKALTSMGKVFVIQHGAPKGVTAEGHLVTLAEARVEIQDR
jgi:hypothetical protein